MKYMEKYQQWLEKADQETIKELKAITDEKEIEDRFYKTLEFGTAGLRGVMGAGTNRMNKYVVGQATQALANHIKNMGREEDGVVIAYDCRINSKEFALYCGLILANNQIKVYLFEDLRPTPELSYAIRRLKAVAGLNITASHNPPEYNGYKVFWDQGSQILSDIGDVLLEENKKIDLFKDVVPMDEEQAMSENLLHYIGKEIDDLFVNEIKALALQSKEDMDTDVPMIYTPLHGTGQVFIPRVLEEMGFTHLTVVEEQKEPDGTFPTASYPNPEDPSVFELALKYAKKEDAELIMATDPDGDRITIMIKNDQNEYIHLNGNQLGALLVHYRTHQMKKKGLLKGNEILIKSIVTGDMGKAIVADHGIKTFETLTGFKYICGLYNDLEKTGEYTYLFGYEESIGFCPETFTRDKNAISTAAVIAEMCGYYQKRGKTIYQVLQNLYQKYGFYKETLKSITYKGIEGVAIKNRVMDMWRKNPPVMIHGQQMEEVFDYLELVEDHIERSNVLKFVFEDGSWYAVRPSGTEPKLKIYIYVVDKTEKSALEKRKGFEEDIIKTLKSFEKEG